MQNIVGLNGNGGEIIFNFIRQSRIIKELSFFSQRLWKIWTNPAPSSGRHAGVAILNSDCT